MSPDHGPSDRSVELPYEFSRDQVGTVQVGHANLARSLATSLAGQRVWAVCDEAVWPLLHEEVRRGLATAEHFDVLQISAGERAKSRDEWWRIIEWLLESGARRRDILIAVGGSTISDVVGFAASTYLRGIPYINIPTTLLAQVDGSVGGKVAINTTTSKNTIGAFFHPIRVIVDVATLATLPAAEMSAGFAESIKVSLNAPDGHLFEIIERAAAQPDRFDHELLTEIVRYSLQLKLDLLRDDPFEKDLRRFLNFGHTVGHAVESATQYAAYRHGEAVALGMATALRVGLELDITEKELVHRHARLLEQLRLPTRLEGIPTQSVVEALDGIRLVRDGRLQMVIPVDFGSHQIVEDVPSDVIERALT